MKFDNSFLPKLRRGSGDGCFREIEKKTKMRQNRCIQRLFADVYPEMLE